METNSFLKQVLAQGDSYCVFAAKPDGAKTQKFYPTIERLLAAADQFDDSGYDVYFGLATFDDTGERKAKYAMHMRSLFVDLDCGPTKDYDDQKQALDALQKFCKSVGMPKPLMVSSGYGIHAYWPLTDDVEIADWKPVAEALKRTSVARGLYIDTSVTADAARILRMPGTRNHKRDTPVPVEMLAGGKVQAHPLSFYADLLAAEAPVPKPAGKLFDNITMSADDDPVMQRLLRNRESSFKQIMVKTAAGHGCAQLGYAVQNQADVDEPLWRATLSIAKFCADGDKAAHRVSAGHPDYSSEATEAKMVGIKGPYTCETFASTRPGGCDDCPLRGKITSPIQLGTVIPEAETEEVEGADGEPTVVYKDTGGLIPPYPPPFKRMSSGGVAVRQKNDDGDYEDVMIYMHDLYYTKRVVDPEAGECIIGRLHLPNDGAREFAVPLVSATSKEELRKILSKYGVAVGAKRWEHIMAYTQAWIEQLQVTTIADNARTQFGWTDDQFTSYVVGDREIFADRVGYNPPSSKTSFLFPAFKPRGSLEGWVEQAKFYNRPGLEPYQFVVCQALAAPLMRFMPVHAAIFDFYSDGSGHGKSTTQKFALTAYGDPSDLIVGPKDTLNARMNRMELMKDVALQFDEFTEFPAEDTSDLIYGATDGRQKARMASGSNEERYRGDAWHTTLTASSNHSMLAKVYARKATPEAEVQRVLRYHVQPHNFTDKHETDVFAKGVGNNCGHAIEVFVQRIMQDAETTRELLNTIQAKIDRDCDLTMKNRFWSVQGAVAMAALVLARDAGLLTYDPAALYKWIIDLIKANKADANSSVVSIDTLVNDFVHENYGSILWIKSTEDLRGGNNGNGLDSLVVPEMQPRATLVARYETDIKKLYIALKPLKSWCVKQRLNYDSVVKQMAEKYGAQKIKIRMSKGTKLNLPTASVIAIDCSGLDLPEGPDGGAET